MVPHQNARSAGGISKVVVPSLSAMRGTGGNWQGSGTTPPRLVTVGMRIELLATGSLLGLSLLAANATEPTNRTIAAQSDTEVAPFIAMASDTGKLVAKTSARTSRQINDSTVHTDMRHVNMHIEPGIVLMIERLHGTVLPTHRNSPPALNDKSSMIIDIESGDIAIDTLSLATLLNRHVFGYAGAPLRNLHVSVEGNEMVQTGSLKKVVWLSFRIRATVALTPEGDIRVHPTAIKVAGIGVKGLSSWLGGLSKLITLAPGHGARIDGSDFILSPTEMLPPPKIRGKLTSIKLEPGGLRQTFGSVEAARVPLVHRDGSTAKNYMYFHGGTLRFGKLTMSGTDLEIVDMDQTNPFDYALDRYQEHLVAGHSNTTSADGLIVVMPDVQKLPSPKPIAK